jgi:hypothetical protein
MDSVEPSDTNHVSEHDLALELKSILLEIEKSSIQASADTKQLRSDFKYWLIAAVIGSQTLSHIQLPSTVGYVSGAALVALAIGKTAFGFLVPHA